MKISDFNYNLPDELIAVHPPKMRGTSNLLVLNHRTGQVEDSKYSNLANYLNKGDVLVLNNTKVIKSRLKVLKQNGAEREIVILEKHSTDKDWHTHQALYHGSLKAGDKLSLRGSSEKIEVKEILGGGVALVKSSIDLLKLAEAHGVPPLPPYLNRKTTKDDIKRYQTIFAKDIGSAAAPTASLNMTNELLKKLQAKGVIIKYLTLHVGLGTFLPIRTDDIESHHMHSEYFIIPEDTIREINHTKTNGHKVVAIGTTVARTLEYYAKTKQATGEADIFIYPGYKFQLVDTLLTNFHAPKSTVLMLAAAFASWSNLQEAYRHAITKRYHFLSYGDSMLII